ncbi:MAG TPA: hypothetical protein VNG12_10280 [Acidimicrobiales bacterium]|nr:hypothetical protein [Acidimicrobiales bacterium]
MHSPLFTRVAAAALGLLVIGTALPASAALDKSVSSAQLKALAKVMNNAKHLTYEATYTSVAGGQTTTVTVAQAPPKSYFATSGGAVISDGSKSYYCSTQGQKETCLAATGVNPIAGLQGLFSPAAAITAFNGVERSLVARVAGLKVTSSTATFAGQASACVTVSSHGQTGKYCVTNKGLLAYSGTLKGTYFQLTKYSKSPPASLFTVPAGSTVTLPGGVTIP